tara:strand:- start:93 stop:515 length:423 start_codon:yes stop_codon:yes gene_type:complete
MTITEIQLLKREEAKIAYHKILWLMEFDWLCSPVKVAFHRNAFIDGMVVLDEYITGKRSQFRNNPHTQSQIDLLMNDELLDGLYLSDDGYSRLHITREEYTIDGDEQYQMALVVTCSDPTEKIKRWCHLHASNNYMWRRF